MQVIIKLTSLQMAQPNEFIEQAISNESNHVGGKHFPDFYLLQLVFSFIHFTLEFVDFLCSCFTLSMFQP